MYSIQEHIVKNAYIVTRDGVFLSEWESKEEAEALVRSIQRAHANIDYSQKRPNGQRKEGAFAHGSRTK